MYSTGMFNNSQALFISGCVKAAVLFSFADNDTVEIFIALANASCVLNTSLIFPLNLEYSHAIICHRLPFVDCYKATDIELDWTDTSAFHFDGELGKLELPERISIDPGKLFIRCGE
jgi:hypothetical protein